METLHFSKSVYAYDVPQVQFTRKEKGHRETENYGKVRRDTTITNEDGALVANYNVFTLVAEK